uniref:Cas12f1-like TNB domain-containing protein n=1 Tax=Phytophthora ramorum TaxID=164328 RepID=H3GG36_PHYRM
MERPLGDVLFGSGRPHGRLIRVRGGMYHIAFSTHEEFPKSGAKDDGAVDSGVMKFGTVMNTDGTTFSVTDQRGIQQAPLRRHRRYQKLATKKAATEAGIKIARSAKQRERARLRREIRAINTKITNATTDFHQKFKSVLAAKFKTLLLPLYQTSEMVRMYEEEMEADGTPLAPAQPYIDRRGRKRRIRSSTARAMLSQQHFSFRMLSEYKMKRAGGRLITCDEEYSSTTCSSCGKIKENLGGSEDIFVKNVEMLF